MHVARLVTLATDDLHALPVVEEAGQHQVHVLGIRVLGSRVRVNVDVPAQTLGALRRRRGPPLGSLRTVHLHHLRPVVEVRRLYPSDAAHAEAHVRVAGPPVAHVFAQAVVPERNVLRVALRRIDLVGVDIPVDAVARVHLPEGISHSSRAVFRRDVSHLRPELVPLLVRAVRVRVEHDRAALGLAPRSVRQARDDHVVHEAPADLDEPDVRLLPVNSVCRLRIGDPAGNSGRVAVRRREVVPHAKAVALPNHRVVPADSFFPRLVGDQDRLLAHMRWVHSQLDVLAPVNEAVVHE